MRPSEQAGRAFVRGLELDPQAERARIVIKLFIAHHRPKIHKGLPAIRQHHHETGSEVEVVSDGHIVLKGELGRSGPEVFGELDVNKSLGVGKFMDIVRIDLGNQDPEACTERG